MPDALGPLARKTKRLLSEPTIHFAALGLLLFVAHRLVVGDARTIDVSPVLRDDLARRFRDQSGRWPSPAELADELRRWKTDEALYREALRERLDRQDAVVRTVLADKIRARAALEFGNREPSEAELEQWLADHRSQYETPVRYDCEYVSFPKHEASAEQARTRYEHALATGQKPATLGRTVYGFNLNRQDLQDKLGPELTERICKLPLAKWSRLETPTDLLLWRVNRLDGGLPSRQELRPRLVYDWQSEMRRRAVEGVVQNVVARYRFKEETR